jgi:AcrR family transcriptional regulator
MTSTPSTRERLLAAAGHLFAERGYRTATIADICAAADANVAAVNYHFGDKAKLYAEVWRRAWEEAMRVYPFHGGLPDDAPAEDRLRARILAALRRFFDDGQLGQSAQLLLMEMAHPTDAVDPIRDEVLAPHIEDVRSVLREILGPEASPHTVTLCQLSVMNQCLALGFRRRLRRKFFGREQLSPAEVEALANHITTFSLAGLRAVREKAAVETAR